ncbi:MAG: hypothetical protein K2X87_32675, partial [Gemmataceae bacterium]|nr:hypothetical protein [Gemmataceae bacterium]
GVWGTAGAQPPPPVWAEAGPAPNTRGQVEKVKDGEVSGAVNAVAPHPTDPKVLYVGGANGGVWMTADATAPSPTWKRLTHDHPSLSVGALEFDPTDPAHQTLVAGAGRFSSFLRAGGARAGLLRTTDGGGTWTTLDGGGALVGLNVSGVAPRWKTIVLSANDADDPTKTGVWRSTDAGATWKQVSGAAGTGLPAGRSSDLAGSHADPNRLFTHSGSTAATVGVYRSTDAGATWAKVSSPAVDARLATAGNVKFAVGYNRNVFVAVVVAGRLDRVFRSGDGGTTWADLGAPATSDGVGAHPGGQGGIHLSIAADPNNADIVYVGGDRQNHPFPNAIGARDFSGRLFRGDASKPEAQRWAHLTHQAGGSAGGGTANGSAPHADSRDMRVAADGSLIESDDGGVYRRTDPRSAAGDWFSLNGDLQVAEFHAVAWDAVADVVIGGAQDTGSPEHQKAGNRRWRSVSTADGGVVAVDDRTDAPARSTRYSSNQNLGGFRRRVYDSANVLQSEVFIPLVPVGGGPPVAPQFYTPIRLNNQTPTRVVIGAANGVYESDDRGDTVTQLQPVVVANGTGPNPLAYGAKDNPDMLYVGSGSRVFTRATAGANLAQSAAYSGGPVAGIAIHPDRRRRAFVVDPARVFRTANAGTTWTNVTGNLPMLNPGTLRSVAFSTATPLGMVVVGADCGVYAAPGPGFDNWVKFGTGLPRVPVYCLEYDRADRVLLAGTLGRGAWTTTLTTPPESPEAEPAEPPDEDDPTPAPKGVAADPAPAGPKPADPPAPPQPPAKGEVDPMATVQLRPGAGAIVDATRGHVYVMAAGGGVEALDLATGKPVWVAKEADKPLAVAGDRVIAQAEDPKAPNALKVVVLDRATGKPVATGTQDLPAGVRAAARPGPEGEFMAAASAAGGGEA